MAILISDLKLPLDFGPEELRAAAAVALGVKRETISRLTLTRQSIDARRRGAARYVCAARCEVEGEEALLARPLPPHVRVDDRVPYAFPTPRRDPRRPRPVVVGMGPAGLLAALELAQAGLPPILLERGGPVEERTARVERFWAGGGLDPVSNVQFGEGGAGTFSDGKLTTGIHDRRVTEVLDTFVRFGGPEDIRYSHKPHIGTDMLRQVVERMRRRLLELGCDIRFYHQLTDLKLGEKGLEALVVRQAGGDYELPCDTLILAPGHSARDTFAMLERRGIPMEAKPFAIGVRIEHGQEAVSRSQYGPDWDRLPPSDYKLACHLPNGRGVFSFCVCPGGQVVAAASEAGGVVTNGMSLRARDGRNINGGLLVGVTPEDLGPGALAGVEFQRLWERRAFALGGGDHRAPAQNVESFLKGTAPSLRSPLTPTYRPGVTAERLEECLPPYVTGSLRQAIPLLGRKLRGFDAPGALLTGVETRSSSPVRLLRDGERLESPVRGIFPCGEGAGWAGGITSAAVDGIKVAEQVALSP